MAKHKAKTHKASAKRFKVTASGKLFHGHQNDNAHLKVNKSNKKLRRQEGESSLTSNNETKKIKRLMNI